MNVREWALPIYTILMQLSTGLMLVLWFQRTVRLRSLDESSQDRIFIKPVLIVLVSIITAIVGAHFHLSEPLLSFLAVLNLGNSWLSREILFTMLMLILVVLLVELILNHSGWKNAKTVLGWVVVCCGLTSIFSMSNIYLISAQTPWNNGATIGLFYGSTLLLGATSAVALLLMDAVFSQQREPDLVKVRVALLRRSLPRLAILALATAALILTLNLSQVGLLRSGDQPAQISLTLLFGLYRPLLVIRYLSLFAGVSMLVIAAFSLLKKGFDLPKLVSPVYLSLFLTMVAEILGRFLFYATHVRVGL